MKFEKIIIPPGWQETFTKYPNGKTIFEALSTTISSVNESIETINNKMIENINEINLIKNNTVEVLNEIISSVNDQINDDHTIINNNVSLLTERIESIEAAVDVFYSSPGKNAVEFENGFLEEWGTIEINANENSALVTFLNSFLDFSKVTFIGQLQYVTANGGSLQLKNSVTTQMVSNNTGYVYAVNSDGTIPTFKRKIAYRAIGKYK